MRYLSGRIHLGGAAEAATALGILGLAQVPPAGTGAHNFPPAVILNRLAADFLVRMPFGRRINQFTFSSKERRNIGGAAAESRIFCAFRKLGNAKTVDQVGSWGGRVGP